LVRSLWRANKIELKHHNLIAGQGFGIYIWRRNDMSREKKVKYFWGDLLFVSEFSLDFGNSFLMFHPVEKVGGVFS